MRDHLIQQHFEASDDPGFAECEECLGTIIQEEAAVLLATEQVVCQYCFAASTY